MTLETSVPQCGNYNQLADSQRPAPPPSVPSVLYAVPQIIRSIQHPHNLPLLTRETLHHEIPHISSALAQVLSSVRPNSTPPLEFYHTHGFISFYGLPRKHSHSPRYVKWIPLNKHLFP